jgi:hypothetical protein
MTAGTTTLNPGTGGDKVLNDSLTSVDGAAAPAGAVAQIIKPAFGSQGSARMVDEFNGMPISNVPPLFWRVGFAEVGAGLQGLAATELVLMQTGAGMAVNQSGGNLVITTGTTVNSETVIRSVLKFKGSLMSRYKAILSQRIANQTFRFELADLIGTGLAYTINSATSVTVTFPTVNPFTAASVGQSLRLSTLSSVGIPGRYAIASVSGLTVTFTVAAWPASGSGTLTLYGFNWLANEYSGTTPTNSSFDCQRRGWNSGNTAATIQTTASPGHVAQIAFDVMASSLSDALVASNTGYQWATRASRIENIPDEDVELYFFMVVQNGSTAPASTTTLTVGFVQVEDQGRQKVRVASSDPVGSHPQPVQIMGGALTVTANQGTMAALPAGANLVGDVGVQVRATTPGTTIANVLSAATNNLTQLKASAGKIAGGFLTNTTASLQYVKLFALPSASVTMGTTAATTQIALQPNQTVNLSQGDFGTFLGGTGLSYAITTGSGLTDNVATTAGSVVGYILWI